MIIDALKASFSQPIAGTVCVLGAGPAGICISIALARRGVPVVLIESGGLKFDTPTQSLSEAIIETPHSHAPLHEATRRILGGASSIWGGRCVPLDPIDFEERPYLPDSGWPIPYEQVSQYYDAACRMAFCGTNVFDARIALPDGPESIVPGLPDGDIRTSDLERWSLPTDFGREYFDEMEHLTNLRVLINLTCVSISVDQENARAGSLLGRTMGGKETRIQFTHLVIATGGLESTRLLLHLARANSALEAQWKDLGRYYMGHISGKIASVHFSTPPRETVFGFERDAENVFVRRRFTFSAETQRRNELLNTALWLDNPRIHDASHRNGVLSSAYLALSTPYIRDCLAAPAIAKAATASRLPDKHYASHFKNVILDLPATISFALPFLFQRYVARRKIPGFFLYNRANRYALHYHGEQAPNELSRVMLSDETDAMGMYRLRVALRYSSSDVTSVVRSHDLLDKYLRKHGVGKLIYIESDLHECVRRQASDGFHQIGTTRMSGNMSNGVVDANCKVHGLENVYIASSSIFPTSGQANPTLTIVALGLRLSEHLVKTERLVVCGA